MITPNGTRSDVDLVVDRAGQGLAIAAAAKVAVAGAAKVAVTAATVAVALPAVKAASVGAGIVQLALDRYQSIRKARAFDVANQTATELEAQAAALRAEVARRERSMARAAAACAKTDRFLAALPAGPPTPARVARLALAGAAIGAALPAQHCVRLAVAVIACIVAARSMRAVNRYTHAVLEERAGALSAANAAATAAMEAAAEAATLSGAILSGRASEQQVAELLVDQR